MTHYVTRRRKLRLWFVTSRFYMSLFRREFTQQYWALDDVAKNHVARHILVTGKVPPQWYLAYTTQEDEQ
jgi:hypothetical protein